ncbi:putative metal-dependent HD superfamily phosphohydrolase [Pseudomonas sp. TE3786]
MPHLSASRWDTLWRALGATPPANSFAELTAHYSEPQRHYHNGAHIDACLKHLDTLQHLANDLPAVEFALWTHDAIYNTQRQDNEALSADLAEQLLTRAGIPQRVAEVRRHILATAHSEPADADDAGLVVDIDLSVLALPEQAYHAYTQAIRAEFAWVPEPLFNAGRAKVLSTLLQMPHLYSHQQTQQLWEARARANLQRELQQLQA